MAVSRPTYPTKTNDPSDADSVRKFYATEANEIKDLFNEYGDHIDALNAALGITSPTISIGSFKSLPILQAAYPDGSGDSYAVIDDGLGSTQQVATYNSETSTWQTPSPDEPIIYIASFSELPDEGVASKLYLILDSGEFRYWNNSQWKTAGGSETQTLPVQYLENNSIRYRVIKGYQNAASAIEEGDKIDCWIDGIDGEKTQSIAGEVLDASISLPDDFSDSSKFFKTGGKTRRI